MSIEERVFRMKLAASGLLIILLFFGMVGCSDKTEACKNDLKKCQLVTSSNLRFFHDKCKELAKCMKAEFEIVHFNNQPHNPYACSIRKQGKTRRKGQYIYPKADLSFGEASASHLDNEITICEIMTETGNQSDAYYKRMHEAFKEMDRRRAERNKAPPTPTPMKIREG